MCCINLRFRQFQPSQDCALSNQTYQTPEMAGIYESSITTFNHLQYSFNGKGNKRSLKSKDWFWQILSLSLIVVILVAGEYALVRVVNSHRKLEVQGRFEQGDSIYGSVNTTRLTSVVAVSDNCVPIEVIFPRPFK